mgnify:CR=1 FL=1
MCMHSVGATGSALLPTNNIANNPGASRNPAELESVPPSARSYREGCRYGDGNCTVSDWQCPSADQQPTSPTTRAQAATRPSWSPFHQVRDPIGKDVGTVMGTVQCPTGSALLPTNNANKGGSPELKTIVSATGSTTAATQSCV